jgi:hypothetical protein
MKNWGRINPDFRKILLEALAQAVTGGAIPKRGAEHSSKKTGICGVIAQRPGDAVKLVDLRGAGAS